MQIWYNKVYLAQRKPILSCSSPAVQFKYNSNSPVLAPPYARPPRVKTFALSSALCQYILHTQLLAFRFLFGQYLTCACVSLKLQNAVQSFQYQLYQLHTHAEQKFSVANEFVSIFVVFRVFALFTCSQTFHAKSCISLQFESFSFLFVHVVSALETHYSKLGFQSHHKVKSSDIPLYISSSYCFCIPIIWLFFYISCYCHPFVVCYQMISCS